MTLSAAAKAAGVSASMLSRFERGIHAARVLTAVGGGGNGATSISALAISNSELAHLLGFESAAALTRACARMDQAD